MGVGFRKFGAQGFEGLALGRYGTRVLGTESLVEIGQGLGLGLGLRVQGLGLGLRACEEGFLRNQILY